MQLYLFSLLLLISQLEAAAGRKLEKKGPGVLAAAVNKPNIWDLPVKNERPLIGILAQGCRYCPGKSYVASAFSRWVESAGGRPVPIRYYASDAELLRLFKSVNGIIFPGGLTNLWVDSPYVIAARKLWNWAKEANDNGDPFPIHGTCLGFQLLHILEVNISFVDLLVETDSVSHPTTLTFTEAAKQSTMYGDMDEDLFAKLADPAMNISFENHMFGLPPSHYQEWPLLGEKFMILTTTSDRQGTEYISTAEHKQYPFFATQWHPEKPPFEFGNRKIPHSKDAIRASQHLGHTFVDAARRSSHFPESFEQELDMLIYNYKPYFTLKDSVMDASYDGPDMVYFFDQNDEPGENGLGARLGSTSYSNHLPSRNAPQQAVLRRGGEDNWVAT